MDHVVETNAAERPSEFLLGGYRTGSTTLATSSEFGSSRLRGLCRRAKNIVCRHAAAFARKFITAMRAADALEDAVAHQ